MKLQFEADSILTGTYTLKRDIISMNLYDSNGQLNEEVKRQIYLAENTLFFYYDATDYYKKEIRDLLSPNDYKETIINSLIVADSYKKSEINNLYIIERLIYSKVNLFCFFTL